jgi:hypothetical protein
VTEPCRVYWGHNGCDLDRHHAGRHRDDNGREITPEEAVLFGEDLTTEEREQVADLWGEP